MVYKKNKLPRSMLKGLAADIEKMVDSNEGCLFALEIIEEIPYEIREDILEGLSSFHSEEMLSFFKLLSLEYGKEMQATIGRGLKKIAMAGLQADIPIFEGDFYKAYATCTRHSGQITLDIAWKTESKDLHVESFYLTFNADGIHSFFLIENMPVYQYEKDRDVLTDMVELNFSECCYLINEANRFNLRCMSRPALGKFLYQKYLDNDPGFSDSQARNLMKKVSNRLTPRQLVNSFFYAIKHQDLNYIITYFYRENVSQRILFSQLNNALEPGALLLEVGVDEVKVNHDEAELKVYSITKNEHDVYRNSYIFNLHKDNLGYWFIRSIDRNDCKLVDMNSDDNPFSIQVYCRVYEIVELEQLFNIFDLIDNIYEVEELPYGIHMRVRSFNDNYNYGVSFKIGLLADLVINGDEFVIISQDKEAIDDFHRLFIEDYQVPLLLRGDYELSMGSAYNYLSGQYIFFEDILLNDDNIVFEDGMRFITARYMVKDYHVVLERLKKTNAYQFRFAEDIQVFYQIKEDVKEAVFQGEYMLGSNWLSVSTFGDTDMAILRQLIEKDIYDCLEFDGLEIREEGIFEVLTPEVKKQYPDMEQLIKNMYLNKWYYSRIPSLRGMTPSEACETEEGTRLLWAMFKKIKQKEKKHLYGKRKNIALKEYIQLVNFKKERKH